MSKKTKRTLKTIGICVVAFVLTLGLFSMLNNVFGWVNVEIAHVVEAKDVKTLEETKWVFDSTIEGVDGEKAFVIDIEIDSENKDLPSDKFMTIILIEDDIRLLTEDGTQFDFYKDGKYWSDDVNDRVISVLGGADVENDDLIDYLCENAKMYK